VQHRLLALLNFDNLCPTRRVLRCPIRPAAARNAPSAGRTARRERPRKLSAAERSALNQALAKALAFKDARKMPRAREWAAELVRLLKSHDRAGDTCRRAFPVHSRASRPSEKCPHGFGASDAARALWTRTIWRDETAMRTFMQSGVHRVMARIPGWRGEATLARVHWFDEPRTSLTPTGDLTTRRQRQLIENGKQFRRGTS
jgi:hypothetical protein